MSFLSVVILTYNQANMVTQCLNSLLSSKTDDVELVISDDHSPDNTVSVIKNWLDLHNNKFGAVVILDNKCNVGTVKNYIKAVEATHSPYIKVIAGDDWFMPGAIDIMRSFCEKNDFDIAFTSLNVAYQDNRGNVEISDEIVPASRVKGFFKMGPKDQFRQLTKWPCLAAPGNLFTRKYWDIIELKNADISIGEDLAMTILGASNSMKFMEIPGPLVVYRKHDKSVTRNTANPRIKIVIKDLAWVLWNVGFSRKDWLTVIDKIRLCIMVLTLNTVSILPLRCITFLDKARRLVGPIFFKRNFT